MRHLWMLLAVVSVAACSATPGGQGRACGSFNVGTSREIKIESAAGRGVQCLMTVYREAPTDATERPSAQLDLAYETSGVRFAASYQVLSNHEVLVSTSRTGPEVPPDLQHTKERCSVLTVDMQGFPVAPPSQCVDA